MTSSPRSDNRGISPSRLLPDGRGRELGFAVRRPGRCPASSRSHRPSGGDVLGGVDIGVTAIAAGHTLKDRLALAGFRCGMPAGRTPLRGICRADLLDSAGGLVAKARDQEAPALRQNASIESSFLANVPSGCLHASASGPGHIRDAQILDTNNVESSSKVGRKLLCPVLPPSGFLRLQPRKCLLRSLAAIRATAGAGKPTFQVRETLPFSAGKPRTGKKFSGRECGRDLDATIDSDCASRARSWDWLRDRGKSHMPSADSVTGDSVGFDVVFRGPRPPEAHPADFRNPHAADVPVESLNMFGLDGDLAEALVDTGLTPIRPSVGLGREVVNGLGEITQRLLLNCHRALAQPIVLGSNLGKLTCLFSKAGGGTSARAPMRVLLDREVPDEPRVRAMLKQPGLLRGCRQQTKTGHNETVARPTDKNSEEQ